MNDSVAKFKAYLALIPQSVRVAANAELKKQATDLALTMARVVPEDKGVLRDSIRIEPQELRVFVRAGGPTTTRPVRDGYDAEYDYALGMEFGNSQVEAQPYFWPTYRLKKKGIRAAIRKAIKTAIQRVRPT